MHPKIKIFEEQTKIPDTFVSGILFLFQMGFLDSLLKLKATDGKMRITDVADVKGIFRLIQSIPSPKAEPFKQWLAKVGYERLQEIQDPSLSMDKARENWIQQRMTGQETRMKLTDYWKERLIKPMV